MCYLTRVTCTVLTSPLTMMGICACMTGMPRINYCPSFTSVTWQIHCIIVTVWLTVLRPVSVPSVGLVPATWGSILTTPGLTVWVLIACLRIKLLEISWWMLLVSTCSQILSIQSIFCSLVWVSQWVLVLYGCCWFTAYLKLQYG